MLLQLVHSAATLWYCKEKGPVLVCRADGLKVKIFIHICVHMNPKRRLKKPKYVRNFSHYIHAGIYFLSIPQFDGIHLKTGAETTRNVLLVLFSFPSVRHETHISQTSRHKI